MSNHPNRGPKGPASNPEPAQVKAARAATGLTQTQAANVVYSTIKSWQAWEAGTRRMPPGLWELFNIKTRGRSMISNIELTERGVDKFNTFFAAHARDGVSMQAVLFEMLDILQDRASMDESLVYELGRQYTTSGNPELLTLDSGDVLLTTEDDE